MLQLRSRYERSSVGWPAAPHWTTSYIHCCEYAREPLHYTRGDTIQTSTLALLKRLAWLKDMLRLRSWCDKSSVGWPAAPHSLFVFAASHNQMNMNILVFGFNVHSEPSRNDISTSLCLQSLIWTSSGHLRGPSTSTSTSTSAIRMGMSFFFANASR